MRIKIMNILPFFCIMYLVLSVSKHFADTVTLRLKIQTWVLSALGFPIQQQNRERRHGYEKSLFSFTPSSL